MAKKLPRNIFKLPPEEELKIPYESLIGVRVVEPILNAKTHQQILAAVANFTGAIRWEKWGMSAIKKQGSLVLLTGPSGVGKTTIARYLAKKVGNGFIPISMADIGSSDPGATERNLHRIFEKAESEGNTTIFMDECDAILWSREKAGPDSMWMLSIINGILTRIEKFSGLVLLATNMKHFLDAALIRRITDFIEVGMPDENTRKTLWEEKIPLEYPCQPTPTQFAALAKFKLTGAEIENCIVAEAKTSIITGRHPNYASLCNIAKSYEANKPTKASKAT